jgi:hypothetical protein
MCLLSAVKLDGSRWWLPLPVDVRDVVAGAAGETAICLGGCSICFLMGGVMLRSRYALAAMA